MNIHTTPNALQNAGEKLYRIISVITPNAGCGFPVIRGYGVLRVRYFSDAADEWVVEQYDLSDAISLTINSAKAYSEITLRGNINYIEFRNISIVEINLSANHKITGLNLMSGLQEVKTLNISGNTLLENLIMDKQPPKVRHILCASYYDGHDVVESLGILINDSPNGKLTLYGNGKWAKELMETAEEAGWTVERIF